MSTVLRVFPRRTKATPTDALAFIGNPPLFWPEADAVHVSVALTWDRASAWHWYRLLRSRGAVLAPFPADTAVRAKEGT